MQVGTGGTGTAMTSLLPCFKKLVNSLPTGPLDPQTLDSLVKKALEDSKNVSSIENRKTQWEYLLKNEVFTLAVCVSNPQSITIVHILCTGTGGKGFEGSRNQILC